MPQDFDENELRRRLSDAIDPIVPRDAESRVLPRFHARAARRRTMSWRGMGGALASVAVVAVVAAGVALALVSRHETGVPVRPSAASSSGPSLPAATTNPAAVSPSARAVRNTPFDPRDVTAVSDSQFWVLGTATQCSPCAPAVLHTTDAGKSFSRLSSPPTTFAEPGAGNSGSINNLRFADGENGYAFGPGLWVTHDDGTMWRRILLGGDIVQLEPGADDLVYAVTQSCNSARTACFLLLWKSIASGDAWHSVLTVSGAGGAPSLGVHGISVWLMSEGRLWHSADAGASFSTSAAPCSADLGGSIDPVTASVVWAYCPTGMMGRPELSTDGGVSFVDVMSSVAFNNSAMVAGTTAGTAFVTDSGVGPLAVTHDGGASYHSAGSFSAAPGGWVGFTDGSTGYYLFVTTAGTESQLWRTADAGSHWSRVAFG